MVCYSIEDVLPHQRPMILIDTLDSYAEMSAECSVNISHSSPFYDEDKQGVPTYIGCEYMAQTIAAFAGAHALDKNEKVKVGFLLGTRKYKTYQTYFYSNTQLKINVNELYNEESGLSVFDCTIMSNDILIAEAKINVFQPQNSQAFLESSSNRN